MVGDVAELVDATDLKSVDLFDREGSSPSIPTVKVFLLKKFADVMTF